MQKRNKIALGIFVVFYVSFGIFLTLNQESVVYHPFPQDFITCTGFENAEKVTYQGTRMYVKKTDGPAIVLYHGNAGSACDRDFYADLFTQHNYSYVIVEYAGFSNDSRSPSHALIKKDVENVVSYLEKESMNRVIIVGESVGTGFASYHTSLVPPERVLLISPFTDLSDVAKGRFWFYPTSLLVDNALNNVEALKKYTGVVTIIHGTKDTIIPYKLGNQLYQSLQAKKEIVTIDGAGHNDLFMFEKTYSAINEFLDQE